MKAKYKKIQSFCEPDLFFIFSPLKNVICNRQQEMKHWKSVGIANSISENIFAPLCPCYSKGNEGGLV